MEAGRELDALIAEKVMGWRWQKHPEHDIRYFRPIDVFRYGAIAQGDLVEYTDQLPLYSTDIAAAWQVVDAMAERGFWCQMRNPFEGYGKGDYWAGFTPHSTTGWNGKPDHWTAAETMPLAICLAALEAVGDTE